jgi:hemerythrin-like domain-containing protein
MLLKKNIAYGNSALKPIRVFSTASTSEQLLVRIDDKLNRLKNGVEYQDEDAIDDLIGYLILLKVQYAKENNG